VEVVWGFGIPDDGPEFGIEVAVGG